MMVEYSAIDYTPVEDELITDLYYSGSVIAVDAANKPCGKECPRNKGEAKVLILCDGTVDEIISVPVCLGKEDLNFLDLEEMIGGRVTANRVEWIKNGAPYSRYWLTA